MINFTYVKTTSPKNAVALIAKDVTAKFIAGGTNLVDLMKKDIAKPEKLIDLTGITLNTIDKQFNNLVIGAILSNSQVADNAVIKAEHPLLALAIKAGASQQIRNMATVGGNIMQRTRCSYFYNIDMPCNKREPGTGCGALKGYNRMHAIFGASDNCIAVHPSDMCVALAALDAAVIVSGPKGDRKIPFTKFHKLPGTTPQKDNTLEANELIVGISVPDNNFKQKVHYLKVRDRSSYAFALISVAAALDIQNGIIKEVRLAMGGVAHKPWRLTEAENYLKGKQANIENYKKAATLAMTGAKAYGQNNFKLKLAPASVVEALTIAATK